MEKNESRKLEISYDFLGAVYGYLDYEKETHFLKTRDGEHIYYAEIHAVTAIRENDGIHITGLAEKLGVTIGAVSQILMKLEKKGLIKKEKDVWNQSRFLLTVTPEGEEVHNNHLKFHEEFDDVVYEVVNGGSAENVAFLKRFLRDVQDKLREKRET